MAYRGTQPGSMYIRVGCGDRSVQPQGRLKQERDVMLTKSRWMSAAVALTAFSTLAAVSLTAAPAEAAMVYCKTAGVSQGCIVRTQPRSGWRSAAVALTAFSTLAAVSLTAAPAEAAMVYCKTAGVSQGCIVRTQPVVRPGGP